MCVIVAHPAGKVPARRILEACYYGNSDGIGIAYKQGNGKIRFHRGISFSDMERLVAKVADRKIPYILHFRFATIGDRGLGRLCHPFPVSKELDDIRKLQGEAKAVLAHNGTWRDMDSAFPQQLVRQLINDDGWSDSALIAWGIGKGKEIRLDQNGYGNRIAMLYGHENFGVDGTGLRLWGRGWIKDEGIWYSNSSWRGYINSRNRINYGLEDYDDSYSAAGWNKSRDVSVSLCAAKNCHHPINDHMWKPEEARWKKAGFTSQPQHGCRVRGCACMQARERCGCGGCVLLDWTLEFKDTTGRFGPKGKVHTPDACYTVGDVNESPDSCNLPALPMQKKLEEKNGNKDRELIDGIIDGIKKDRGENKSITLVRVSTAKEGWCACGDSRFQHTTDRHSTTICKIGQVEILLNCVCTKPLTAGNHSRRVCSPRGATGTFRHCGCGNYNLPGSHSGTICRDTQGQIIPAFDRSNRSYGGPFGGGYARTGHYVNGRWVYNDEKVPIEKWGTWIDPDNKSTKGGYCIHCGAHCYQVRRTLEGTAVPVCYRKECEDLYPKLCEAPGCKRKGDQWILSRHYCGQKECEEALQRISAAAEAKRKAEELARKVIEEYETGKFEVPGLGTFNKRETFGSYTLTTGISRRTRQDAAQEKAAEEAAMVRLEKEWLNSTNYRCDICQVYEPGLAPLIAQGFLDSGFFVCARPTCRNLAVANKGDHPKLEERLGEFLDYVKARKAEIETRKTGQKKTEEDPGSEDGGGNDMPPPGFCFG